MTAARPRRRLPRLRVDGPAFTALVTSMAAVATLSNTLYVASLPSLVEAFATTSDRVKLTLSGYLAAFAVAQLVYGPLSDRIGRRPVLLAGLAIYVLGSLACLFSPTIEAMIAARCLQAAGACAGIALSRAIVRDVHGREDSARIFAWISAALALSPALGPTIGGLLQVWFGWEATFVVLVVGGLAILLFAALFLTETNRQKDPEATDPFRFLANTAILLRHRRFVGYLLTGALTLAGLYAYIAAGPFIFMQRLGLRPDQYGMLTIFSTSAYLGGSLLAARLSRLARPDAVILAGTALSVAGGACLLALSFLVVSVPSILGPMMLFSLGMGLTLPNTLAGGMGPFPQIAGTASALIGFAQQGLAAAATIAAAALPQLSATAMGGLVGALALAALLSRLCLIGSGRARLGSGGDAP